MGAVRIHRNRGRRNVVVAFLAVATATVAAQGGKAELGRLLFESPALSSSGKMSCATCHEPGRSFTDGLPQTKGQTGANLRRNTPTLVGTAHMAFFPNPKQPAPSTGTPVAAAALTLDERCLAPLENEAEMGKSADDAVARLAALPDMPQAFDRAFGASYAGVTRERLGQALGAFVRAIEPAPAPWQHHLTGNVGALAPQEQRGLEVFEGKGRCTECHAGPALTDGLLAIVRVPANLTSRMTNRRGTVRTSTTTMVASVAARARVAGPAAPGAGPYSLASVEEQPPPLLDVTRTGPWFRDGSAASLEDALVRHVRDLRDVAERREDVIDVLVAVGRLKGAPPAKELVRKPPEAKHRVKLENPGSAEIDRVLAEHPQLLSDAWVPEELNPLEIRYLLDFLAALTPAA